jgi:DNA-directed RNA polymerase specialized sigma subunit
MQNYYDTQKKLELDRRGLKLLYDQKAELRATVEPKSVVTDKVMIAPVETPPDKALSEYVDNSSEIDKKIESKRRKIKDEEAELQAMETILRGIHDIKYKIFVMRFIDNLSVRKISRILSYDRSTIYRIIEKIEKEMFPPDR